MLNLALFASVLLVLILSCHSNGSINLSREFASENNNHLMEILFPNRTKAQHNIRSQSNRRLDFYTCQQCPPYDLNLCTALRSLLIEEVYFPVDSTTGVVISKDATNGGTCAVIESLAVRVNSEIFGIGRSFRDTPQCRGITTLNI